jgi:hypothetical protein
MVLAALALGVGLAADTSGRILGTVKDPAGNVIPGAAMTLSNQARAGLLPPPVEYRLFQMRNTA